MIELEFHVVHTKVLVQTPKVDDCLQKLMLRKRILHAEHYSKFAGPPHELRINDTMQEKFLCLHKVTVVHQTVRSFAICARNCERSRTKTQLAISLRIWTLRFHGIGCIWPTATNQKWKCICHTDYASILKHENSGLYVRSDSGACCKCVPRSLHHPVWETGSSADVKHPFFWD